MKTDKASNSHFSLKINEKQDFPYCSKDDAQQMKGVVNTWGGRLSVIIKYMFGSLKRRHSQYHRACKAGIVE